MFAVTGPDAEEKPFVALLHMDWVEIRKGTQAFKTAQRALHLLDDITVFFGVFPSNSKTKEVVIEAVHRYDDTPPVVRR